MYYQMLLISRFPILFGGVETD
uniref:Uncharacterized protein n=1 Tax=Heterorhabditis bacteriophora TaxID=37862 RepID=A0A1I7WYG9_HETBA